MAAQQIRVVSWQGNDLSGGLGFTAHLEDADTVFGRSWVPVQQFPVGKFGREVDSQPEASTIVVAVTIEDPTIGGLLPDATLQSTQDALVDILEPGSRGSLRIDVGEATQNHRVVEATVQRVIPFADGNPNHFTAILRAADPRWFSAQEHTSSSSAVTLQGGIETDHDREVGTQGDGRLMDGTATLYRGTTNLVPNGGAETDATGWTAGGTNTIAADATEALFGLQSLKAVYQDDALLASHDVTTPTDLEKYTLQAWVWIPSDWDGGDIQLALGGQWLTGTVHDQEDAGASVTGEWQRLRLRFTPAATRTAGSIRLQAATAPSAGKFIYIDGCQVEVGDCATPYIETDGATVARTAGKLEFPAAGKINETKGWVAIRFRPNWSAADLDADQYLWSWYLDANNHMSCWYDQSAGSFRLERTSGGTTGNIAGQVVSVVKGTIYTVVAYWTASGLVVRVDSATSSTALSANIPDLSAATFVTVGEDGTGALQLDGDLVWAVGGNDNLSGSQAATLTAHPTADYYNRLRWSNDFTKRVWQTAGAMVVSGSFPGGAYINYGGGVSAAQELFQIVEDEAYSSADVYTFRVRLSAAQRTEAKLWVGTKAGVGSTLKVELDTEVRTFSISHTMATSGIGVRVAIKSDTSNAKTIFANHAVLARGSAVLGSSVEPPQTVGHDTFPPTANTIADGGVRWHFGGSLPTGQAPTDIIIPIGGDPGPGPQGGFTYTLAQVGDVVYDQTRFRLVPLVNKSTADYWTRAYECIVANRSPEALVDYAMTVTHFPIDHAQIVGWGIARADGNDMRVLVDDVEVPRWVGGGGWNTSTTRIWVNMDLSPAKHTELVEALGSAQSSVGDAIKVKEGGTVGWPKAGFLLIDDEVIEYMDTTPSAFILPATARAKRTTTAATHSVAADIWWVERRVRLLLGYLNAPAPDAHDERKPMLDLVNSHNEYHHWNDFRHSTDPRSMQWALRQEDRDEQFEHLLGGDPGDTPGTDWLHFEYKRDAADSGLQRGNVFTRPFPVPIDGDTVQPWALYILVEVQLDMLVHLRGIDDGGTERDLGTILGNTPVGGGTTTLTYKFTDVDNVYRLSFYGRSFRVAQATPPIESPSPLEAVVLIAAGATAFESLIVPSIREEPALFDRLTFRLRSTAGTTTVTARMGIKDADDVFVPMSGWQGGGSVTTGGWQTLVFGGGTTGLIAGQQLWVELWNTGSNQLEWLGYPGAYGTKTQKQTLIGLSTTLEYAEDAAAADGALANVDNLFAVLDPDLRPYAKLAQLYEVYVFNGFLSNLTTGGQGILLQRAILDKINGGTADEPYGAEIDIKARTIVEVDKDGLPTGRNLLAAATFTDPERWIDLFPNNAVIAVNTLSYAEDGLVALDVLTWWRDVWH